MNNIRQKYFWKITSAFIYILAYQIRTAAAITGFLISRMGVLIWSVNPKAADAANLIAKKHFPRGRCRYILNITGSESGNGSTPAGHCSLRVSAHTSPVILRDKRVQNLQKTVVKVMLERNFHIVPTATELEILKRFSSAGWILSNLLQAAGCGKVRRLNREKFYRIKVVYPVFINILHLHFSYLEENDADSLKCLFKTAGLSSKKIEKFLDGCISQSVFPESISRKRLKAKREEIDERVRLQLRLHKIEGELAFFKLFLDLIGLLNTGVNIREEKANKLLKYIKPKNI